MAQKNQDFSQTRAGIVVHYLRQKEPGMTIDARRGRVLAIGSVSALAVSMVLYHLAALGLLRRAERGKFKITEDLQCRSLEEIAVQYRNYIARANYQRRHPAKGQRARNPRRNRELLICGRPDHQHMESTIAELRREIELLKKCLESYRVNAERRRHPEGAQQTMDVCGDGRGQSPGSYGETTP